MERALAAALMVVLRRIDRVASMAGRCAAAVNEPQHQL
jgi:hypothetical protein